jgi:hypothetical protein
MPRIHWVARQNKLEIPEDKDEVNKRDIHECDGRTHDPDTMVDTLTPKPKRKAEENITKVFTWSVTVFCLLQHHLKNVMAFKNLVTDKLVSPSPPAPPSKNLASDKIGAKRLESRSSRFGVFVRQKFRVSQSLTPM